MKRHKRAYYVFPILAFMFVVAGIIVGMTYSALSSNKTATGTIIFAIADKEGSVDVKNGTVRLNVTNNKTFTTLDFYPNENYCVPNADSFKCYVGDDNFIIQVENWVEMESDNELAVANSYSCTIYEDYLQLKLNNLTLNGAVKIEVECPAQEQTVSFNTNGGNCSLSSKSVAYKSVLGELPDAERAGYSFIGWFNSTLTAQYFETDIVTTNLTLYAKYDPNEYIITLNTNGGVCEKETIGATYGSALTNLPVATKAGHTFLGWFDKSVAGSVVTTSTVYSFDFDTTLYARWQIITFSLTFNANGGTVSTSSMNLSYKQVCASLLVPTYSGYSFLGWYTDSVAGLKFTDAEGNVYANISGCTNEYNEFLLSENLTLYAHWVETDSQNWVNSANFTFDLDETDKIAKVVSCNKSSGNVVIPSYIYASEDMWIETEENTEEDIEYYSVTAVNAYSFSRCSGVTSIKVPNTVQKIEESAFYGCSSIQAIELPFVGTRPLYLENYYGYHTTNTSESLQNCFGIIFGEKEFPNSTACLQGIQKNTWSIGENNMAVKQVYYVPQTLTNVVINAGVNATTEKYAIYSCAFKGCKNIEYVTFNGTKELKFGPMLFADCTNLKEVAWEGASLITAYSGVFYNCTNLEKIGNCISAYYGANFMVNCTKITSVQIGASNHTNSGAFFSGMSTFESVYYCGNCEYKDTEPTLYPQRMTVRMCGLPLTIGDITYTASTVYTNATKNLYVRAGATFGLQNEDFSEVFFQYYADNGTVTIDGIEYTHYVRGAVLNCHYVGVDGEYIDEEGNPISSELVVQKIIYSSDELNVDMSSMPNYENYEVYWAHPNGDIFEIYFTSKVLYVGVLELYLHYNLISPNSASVVQVEINNSTKLYSNSVSCDTLRASDPSIVTVVENGQNVYYLYKTGVINDGIEIFRSTDLVHWESKGTVLSPEQYYVVLNDGTEFDLNWFLFRYWAGECVSYNGKYYMLYTATDKYATLRVDPNNNYYYDANTSEKYLSTAQYEGKTYVLSNSIGLEVSDSPSSGFVPYNNTPYKVVANIRGTNQTIELCVSQQTRNYLMSKGVTVSTNSNYDSSKLTKGVDQPYIANDELYKQAYENHYSTDTSLTMGQKLMIIENGDGILLSNCLPNVGDVFPFVDTANNDLYIYFAVSNCSSSKIYYDGTAKTGDGYGSDSKGNYYTSLDTGNFIAGIKVNGDSFEKLTSLASLTRLTVAVSKNINILEDWNSGTRTAKNFISEKANLRPSVYYKNGFYYLVYNGDGYSNYIQKLNQAYSTSPLGGFQKIGIEDGGVILIGKDKYSFSAFGTGGFVEIGSRTFMVYHARESGNTDDSQRFICVSEVGFVNRTIDGVSVPVMCCVSAGFGCELLPTCNYTNLLLNATIKGHSFLQDASYLVDGLVYNNDNCTALTGQYHASKYDVVTLDFSTAISLNSLMIYAGDDVRLSNFESIRQILLTDSSGNVYRISNQSFDRPASGGDGMFLSFETLANIVQIQLSFSSDMAISEIKGYLIND